MRDIVNLARIIIYNYDALLEKRPRTAFPGMLGVDT